MPKGEVNHSVVVRPTGFRPSGLVTEAGRDGLLVRTWRNRMVTQPSLGVSQMRVRNLLLAGPAALATFLLAVVVGRPFGNLPAPEEVVSRFETFRLRVLLGTWLESLAAVMLMGFAAGLAARIRQAEGEVPTVSAVAQAGGTAAGVLFLARAAATAAAAERAGSAGSSPETAALAVDYANLLVGKMAPVCLAAMTGATALAGQRTGLLPRPMVRPTWLLTAGLVSPLNFVFVVGGLVWVAAVGALLSRNTDRV